MPKGLVSLRLMVEEMKFPNTVSLQQIVLNFMIIFLFKYFLKLFNFFVMFLNLNLFLIILLIQMIVFLFILRRN